MVDPLGASILANSLLWHHDGYMLPVRFRDALHRCIWHVDLLEKIEFRRSVIHLQFTISSKHVWYFFQSLLPQKICLVNLRQICGYAKRLGCVWTSPVANAFCTHGSGDPAWPCHAILDLTSSPEKQRHWRSCGARLEDAVVTGSSRFSKFKAELQDQIFET